MNTYKAKLKLIKPILIFLFFSTFSTHSFAGQGMFIRIKSYLPNTRIEIVKAECIAGTENIAVNQTAYIENTCFFAKNRVIFNVLLNNQLLKQYMITLYGFQDLSQLFSQGVTFIGNKIITANFYPHHGENNSQDRVAISIGPREDIWMKETQNQIANKSLPTIIMPGTHNTGTYGIPQRPVAAPDLDERIQTLLRNDPLQEQHLQYIKGWGMNQKWDVLTQLKLGSRYFDLRVCKDNQNILTTCHGVYAANLNEILDRVGQFLQEPDHDKEIIILELRPLNLDLSNIDKLAQLLLEMFKEKIISPLEFNIVNNVLNDFWQKKKQLLLIMDNDVVANRYPELFWSATQTVTAFWANTDNTAELLDKMPRALQQRDHNKLFLFGPILTPQVNTVVAGLFGNSLDSLIKMTGEYKFLVNDWLDQLQNKTLLRLHGNIIYEDYSNGVDLTELAKELNKTTL